MNLLPIDGVLIVYNLLMIAVWSPLAWTSGIARWMIAVHTAALALPWLLWWAGPNPSRAVAALRLLYPLLWLSAFWRELGIHWEMVGSTPNDTLLATLDSRVFGTNLCVAWPAAMPGLNEVMQSFYFLFYVLLVVALAAFFLSRRRPAVVQEVALRLALAYVGAYVFYAIAPTIGPASMDPQLEPVSRGFFGAIVQRGVK